MPASGNSGGNGIINDANVIGPTGGVGEGVYSTNRLPNPQRGDPVSKEQEAMGIMMGFEKEMQEDLRSWQSVLSFPGRADLGIFAGTLFETKESIEPLSKELELSYKAVSALSLANQNDLNDGNTLIRNNNIRQIRAEQFRVGADTSIVHKTPLYLLGAKESVYQTERSFLHTNIAHTIAKHVWIRAEWAENHMALRRNSYIVQEDSEYVGNKTSLVGARDQYSDCINHKVGKLPVECPPGEICGIPMLSPCAPMIDSIPDPGYLHPVRSRPSNNGVVAMYSLNNQYRHSEMAHNILSAFCDTHIYAVTGFVYINCAVTPPYITEGYDQMPNEVKNPVQMQDPSQYGKGSWKDWGKAKGSRTGKTSEGFNVQRGQSVGAYNTTLGVQKATAQFDKSEDQDQ